MGGVIKSLPREREGAKNCLKFVDIINGRAHSVHMTRAFVRLLSHDQNVDVLFCC